MICLGTFVKDYREKNTLKGITTMISASTNNGQKINEYQDWLHMHVLGQGLLWSATGLMPSQIIKVEECKRKEEDECKTFAFSFVIGANSTCN